jgi:putative peptidoglycan lipid II flippase
VFTELLEQDRRKDAFQLASTLLLLIGAVLGGVTLVFLATAHLVMPLLVESSIRDVYGGLTAGLSMVMFPIVAVLALNGVIVGVLNAVDHFTVPALSPVVWNLVIMVFLVGGRPLFGSGDEQLYAYAIGVLAGTAAQLLIALPVLKRVGFTFTPRIVWDDRVKRVLVLMLPVTVALGLINVNALIDSSIGFLVDPQAPRAIDAAFRIYMLPQGLFSVAIATVLFPALSRLAARKDHDGMRNLIGNGTRLILLLLVPAAAVTLVLAEPITRLVYQRGAFGAGSTELVSEALLWFSISLPLNGLNLLLTRSFFSLQRPWATTTMSVVNLVVNVAASLALYKPLGIGGIVLATGIANLVMYVAQTQLLRRELGGELDGAATARAVVKIAFAAVLLAATGYATWLGLDELLGRSFPGQLVSVGAGILVGGITYLGAVLRMGVEEAAQLEQLVRRRLPGAG